MNTKVFLDKTVPRPNGKRYEIFKLEMPNLRNEKSNGGAAAAMAVSPSHRSETKWKRGMCDSFHTLKYMVHNSTTIRKKNI